MLILAGDIGGTSTRLAFFETRDGGLTVAAEAHYPSREYGSLTEIVGLFVEQHRMSPLRACFGIAGPVRAGTVRTPNLPWSIDAADLARLLGLPEVVLINDLDANAYGVGLLGAEELAVLNEGQPDPRGAIAVVSAGTGLGEAFAYWDGACHRPLPSEAGHADFAPRSGLETELLLYLQADYGRVSYERVISGPGLYNIYRFLRDARHLPETPGVAAAMRDSDPPAVITGAALVGTCPLCGKALDLFMALYGAEAGNAALRFFATGGVYLGGGIAPRIIEKLKGSDFMGSFTAKGRLSAFLDAIPVKVIRNERTALLGAGRCASMHGGVTSHGKRNEEAP
ncbi:MAG TPA: glucokinase [Desulfuromonadaceae bacterium]